ncbi:hypothetical protein L207DRAFT_60130 [Hyaloscypha variabilis F]|uniref:Nephrocystin 3-like N-terminal domain-containing protein n=1 Tax=Hyaloscypha variabilis (strain UAMH 11265 / GT02V1 / F) TaxID=1149755 RepID=A0A2J6RHP6_HYAVF|nr:hypothetical protein L207DRAFT_60130 [Hyaloscypha variabilis F]
MTLNRLLGIIQAYSDYFVVGTIPTISTSLALECQETMKKALLSRTPPDNGSNKRQRLLEIWRDRSKNRKVDATQDSTVPIESLLESLQKLAVAVQRSESDIRGEIQNRLQQLKAAKFDKESQTRLEVKAPESSKESQKGLEQVNNNSSSFQTSSDRMPLRWHRTIDIDYKDQHCNYQSRRIEGTGRWFLETEAYQKWLESGSENVLCCCGIPGSGKSVMALVS